MCVQSGPVCFSLEGKTGTVRLSPRCTQKWRVHHVHLVWKSSTKILTLGIHTVHLCMAVMDASESQACPGWRVRPDSSSLTTGECWRAQGLAGRKLEGWPLQGLGTGNHCNWDMDTKGKLGREVKDMWSARRVRVNNQVKKEHCSWRPKHLMGQFSSAGLTPKAGAGEAVPACECPAQR